MNSTELNIFFLALGIILGFIIAYIIERLKEKRLKRQISILLKNEIANCQESASNELNNLNKIQDFPPNIQKERILLGSLLISREVYGTVFFNSYKKHFHLFTEETQKEVGNFYTLIYVLIDDLNKIGPLAEKMIYPSEAINDFFKIQKSLREDIFRDAILCKTLLEKESKRWWLFIHKARRFN